MNCNPVEHPGNPFRRFAQQGLHRRFDGRIGILYDVHAVFPYQKIPGRSRLSRSRLQEDYRGSFGLRNASGLVIFIQQALGSCCLLNGRRVQALEVRITYTGFSIAQARPVVFSGKLPPRETMSGGSPTPKILLQYERFSIMI